jgi:amino acid transporter
MRIRRLKPSSALFVAIGAGIPSGPLCLLLAFLFWATVIFCIAQCRTLSFLECAWNMPADCIQEMEIVTLFPLDGAFIRLAARM